MLAVVIPIGSRQTAAGNAATWSLLEVARPGYRPEPYGVLVVTPADELATRFRDPSYFESLEEEQLDFLEFLQADLTARARETGGRRLLDSLEDSLSGFLRISDRTRLSSLADPQATADRLFDEYVDSTVVRFVSHLPLYGLRAAATKFGELMSTDVEVTEESWVRVPEKLRLTPDMFVAHVVGRSMDPRIPDGSQCIFRAGVVGSRQGRLLLIEKFDEHDVSARYTVKRYARSGALEDGAEREQKIRLEPLNREFEAFDLESDQFRVVAEFVQVLPS